MKIELALHVLSDAGVDCVVIGGVAGAFHGSGRVTYDLDVCYSRTAQNIRRLAEALAPFHPRPRGLPDGLPFIWDEATLRNGSLFTLHTDLGDIDLLAEVAGLGTYDEVKASSIPIEAFGCRVAVLDLKSLIRAKRAAGRERDLSALPELEALLEAEEP